MLLPVTVAYVVASPVVPLVKCTITLKEQLADDAIPPVAGISVTQIRLSIVIELIVSAVTTQFDGIPLLPIDQVLPNSCGFSTNVPVLATPFTQLVAIFLFVPVF